MMVSEVLALLVPSRGGTFVEKRVRVNAVLPGWVDTPARCWKPVPRG